MRKQIRCLVITIIVAIASNIAPVAAHAGDALRGTEIAQAGQSAAAASVAAPDAETRRLYNRWVLSVSVCSLAGVLVGAAVVTSTPLIASTVAGYAAGTAIIGATTAVGGYLGALWVDY